MVKRKGFFVTGTDTGVGKTLVSLGLCLHFDASYWKPVQTGQPSDSDFIKQFLPNSKIYSSTYELKEPLSPNQAAKIENTVIDLKKITVPPSPFLIVEGIGGVYVPLNDKDILLDLIKLIGLPLIVVARSGLGTLNHSLLTLEALKRRNLKIAGVILSGPKHKANKRDIERWGNTPVVLEIPPLSKITKEELKEVFLGLKIQALGYAGRV